MENFVIKDIYEGFLKTNSPLQMGEILFEAGETVFHFNNIQNFTIAEVVDSSVAKGGYQDAPLIEWESLNELPFSISIGTVSPIGMSILDKTKLVKEQSILKLPMTETLSSDEDGDCVLKYPPLTSVPISIYELNNGTKGSKIIEYQVLENTLKIGKKYSDIVVDYQFNYENTNDKIIIGKKDLNGYFTFVGKFYYTDEITREQKTAIIEIPRVEIRSNFGLTLGRTANPFISNLYLKGLPIGDRSNRKIAEIIFLDRKI